MENYVKYIKKVAKRFYYKHRGRIKNLKLTLGDYESYAAIGVAKAFKNFDPRKGNKLERYAYNYIKQEIKRGLDENMSQNRKERYIGDNVTWLKQPKRNRPTFMCYDTIIKVFNYALDDDEKEVLYLSFCRNKSPYKVAKRLKVKQSIAGGILRRSLSKLQTEIIKYGDVDNLDDIKVNLVKAYGSYMADEFMKESEDGDYR